MRLAVSLLNFRPGRIGGTETYLRRLVAHLPAVAGDDELVVLLHREAAGAIETPGFRRVVVDRGDARIVADRILEAYTPWRARGIERILEGLAADVVLFPQQSIFPRRARVRAVLTAVDVQHLFHPENFGLFDRTFRPAIYPYSLERARRVIAISGFTRTTLLARCGVPPGKVVTVPLGWEPTGAGGVVPTDRVAGPYLYYPAVTHPHKDHATLFRTYAALRRRGDVAERLVLTGARTARWKDLQALAASLGVADDVVHLGYLPYGEVRRVYAGASAVLFPTRFEGFGLPVTEAAEFGKRIVTSRLEVFDEIGVPAENQVDFADPDALLRALRLPGPTRLVRAPISWREMAARTVAVLRDVAAEGEG